MTISESGAARVSIAGGVTVAPRSMAMKQSFDPYHKWLGIPPEDQPPHHYRLLGVG